jgi:hypothetical protein
VLGGEVEDFAVLGGEVEDLAVLSFAGAGVTEGAG